MLKFSTVVKCFKNYMAQIILLWTKETLSPVMLIRDRSSDFHVNGSILRLILKVHWNPLLTHLDVFVLFILNFFFVELYMPGTVSLRVSLTYTILPANTVEALSPCDHSRKRPALVTNTFDKLPLNCDLNIVMKSCRNRPRRVLFT